MVSSALLSLQQALASGCLASHAPPNRVRHVEDVALHQRTSLLGTVCHDVAGEVMRKVRAARVRAGTIVRFEGEWGVLEGSRLERWIGGTISMSPDDKVEVPAHQLHKIMRLKGKA